MNYKIFLALFLTSFSINAQITEPQLDELVNNTLKTFNVPGIAVAIIKDGKIVVSKGYGIANIKTQKKVDGNTRRKNCIF